MRTLTPDDYITADQKAAEARGAQLLGIQRERERRLALGFDYDFGDARGLHHIATSPEDMKGWDEVTMLANAAINAGVATTEILILTSTGPVTITAAEWQQVLLASANFRQPIWQASFALQAADPIPADITDDVHWPD